MDLRMSGKQRDRLKVMAALGEGRLKQKAAGRLLGLSERQVRRVLRRYERQGDAGLVHRGRGRRSNRKTPQKVRRKALACIRRHYRDFGPTLAAEKLAERDGLAVSCAGGAAMDDGRGPLAGPADRRAVRAVGLYLVALRSNKGHRRLMSFG